MKLREKFALEYGVSPATIVRDGYFAEGVDHLAEVFGPEYRTRIFNGESTLKKQEIIALRLFPKTELQNLSEHELKALVNITNCPRPNKLLADAKLAFMKLNEIEKKEFTIWLADILTSAGYQNDTEEGGNHD